MRKIIATVLMLVLLPALEMRAQGSLREVDGSFLRQLQARDSILIADQLAYGFRLDGVEEGSVLGLQEFKDTLMRDVDIVRGWKMDTIATMRPKLRGRALKSARAGRVTDPQARFHYDIEGSLVIAPFEEGEYHLPLLALQLASPDGRVDTLVFDPQVMDVRTMPVDTATFEIHDIKGQIRYPVTAAEVAPYLFAAQLLAILAILVTCLVMVHRRREQGPVKHKDPAYIVALRKLDRYRGDKYWAAEKQKTYYSGLTDTLREYIADRFGIDAMEMTTAEIFAQLKGCRDLSPELYNDTRDLFELADFVKFAKHTASEQENADALPTAVRFVTSTYQAQIEEESEKTKKEEK